MQRLNLPCFFICTLFIILSPALAKTESLPLKTFTSLKIANGKSVTVKCATASSISVNVPTNMSSPLTLENLGITEDDTGQVTIANETPKKYHVIQFYTNQPLIAVSAQNGVNLEIESCAINNKTLKVEGRRGSQIRVAGSVEQLYLTLSSGSSFNTGDVTLQNEAAVVDLSMGSKANLCDSKKISGNLRLGAIALINSQAINQTTTTEGSNINTSWCKR